MKKCLILLLCLTMLCGAVVLPSQGTTLSPGLAVLAQNYELIKGGLIGQPLAFRTTDFTQFFNVRKFSTITLRTLPDPTEGVLKFGEVKAVAGQVISSADIGKLTFTAATPLVTEATFTFSCDVSSQESVTCRIRLCEQLNHAPTVNDLPQTRLYTETQQNLSVLGTLACYDPEGDDVTYMIVTYPENGTLTLTDVSTGDFRYTPYQNYTGTDRFCYVARDEYGNYSTVATVNVTVKKRAIDLEYTDMETNRAYGAALTVTAAGLMQGTIKGDGLYFYPKNAVTRVDFLVMAMKAAGVKPLSEGSATCFDDNSDIDPAVSGYVAAAQRAGVVYGTYTDGELKFLPNETITRAEAAVIVSRLLNPESGAVTVSCDLSSAPVWAEDAVAVLYDLGLFRPNNSGEIAADQKITRAQAAELLAGVMQYCALSEA